MSEPLTIVGELTVPLRVLSAGRQAMAIEAWLHTQGLLPPQVQQCRWRVDPLRQGYVLSYEVVLVMEETP
jgi:hypothetical protein